MLRIAKHVHEAMVAHCRRDDPKEACGLLAGRDGVAAQAHPMTNVDHSPISYAMDPLEQLRLQKAMRAEGTELVAVYHSHTRSPAYPSPTDVQQATYPDAWYVLVSLAQEPPSVRAFRICDGRVDEDDLQIVE